MLIDVLRYLEKEQNSPAEFRTSIQMGERIEVAGDLILALKTLERQELISATITGDEGDSINAFKITKKGKEYLRTLEGLKRGNNAGEGRN